MIVCYAPYKWVFICKTLLISQTTRPTMFILTQLFVKVVRFSFPSLRGYVAPQVRVTTFHFAMWSVDKVQYAQHLLKMFIYFDSLFIVLVAQLYLRDHVSSHYLESRRPALMHISTRIMNHKKKSYIGDVISLYFC